MTKERERASLDFPAARINNRLADGKEVSVLDVVTMVLPKFTVIMSEYLLHLHHKYHVDIVGSVSGYSLSDDEKMLGEAFGGRSFDLFGKRVQYPSERIFARLNAGHVVTTADTVSMMMPALAKAIVEEFHGLDGIQGVQRKTRACGLTLSLTK